MDPQYTGFHLTVFRPQSNQGLGQLLNSFTVVSPSWLNHCVALIDLRFFYTNTKIFGLDLDLMYVPNACV